MPGAAASFGSENFTICFLPFVCHALCFRGIALDYFLVTAASITDIWIREFESHSLRHGYIKCSTSTYYVEEIKAIDEWAGNSLLR